MRPRLLPSLLLAACLVVTGAEAGRGPSVGDPVPPTRLFGADGGTVDLVSPGRVTLLLFWATWSPRSLEALGYLKGLPARYPSGKLSISVVNADGQRMDEQRGRNVAAALKETGFDGVSVIDPALETFNAYGIIALPTFVIVGPDGRLAGFVAGFHFSAPEEVEEVLDRLIPREPVRQAGEARIVPPPPVPRNGADAQLSLAREALRAGRTQDAIEGLSEAVRRDPAFVESAVLLARLLRKEGRGKEADAETARIKVMPLAHPLELAAAASLLLDEGATAEAKEALDGAVRLWPEDSTLGSLRVAARLAMGESPAAGDLATAVAVAPNLPPDVARRLGLALAPRFPREAAGVLRVAIEGILATRNR
jgi:tetratricopeptide (TPR) repeat protein